MIVSLLCACSLLCNYQRVIKYDSLSGTVTITSAGPLGWVPKPGTCQQHAGWFSVHLARTLRGLALGIAVLCWKSIVSAKFQSNQVSKCKVRK